MADTLRLIAGELRRARSVAIVGHLRPDADAVGSVAALAGCLRQFDIPVTGVVGQSRPLPANLRGIPGADRVRPYDPGNAALTRALREADRLVTVDCGALDRTGTAAGILRERADRLIVIDHHGSNPGFGAINHVDATAESTTVIIHQLMAPLAAQLCPDIAAALYAGLVTDTGCFRWGTPRMHVVAAELLRTGIDARGLTDRLVSEVSVGDLRFIGGVLARAEVRTLGGEQVAVLFAPNDELRGRSATSVEILVDQARHQRDAPVGALLKETAPGTWSVSLRSTTRDVSEIAARLGGGGHAPAAGFTLRGSRAEVLGALGAALAGRGVDHPDAAADDGHAADDPAGTAR